MTINYIYQIFLLRSKGRIIKSSVFCNSKEYFNELRISIICEVLGLALKLEEDVIFKVDERAVRVCFSFIVSQP